MLVWPLASREMAFSVWWGMATPMPPPGDMYPHVYSYTPRSSKIQRKISQNMHPVPSDFRATTRTWTTPIFRCVTSTLRRECAIMCNPSHSIALIHFFIIYSLYYFILNFTVCTSAKKRVHVRSRVFVTTTTTTFFLQRHQDSICKAMPFSESRYQYLICAQLFTSWEDGGCTYSRAPGAWQGSVFDA